MRSSRFASIQIQIGAVALAPISQQQVDFHSAVAVKTLDNPAIERIGAHYSIPVSNHDAVHDASALSDRLIKQITALTSSGDKESRIVDSCILDLCTTPFFTLREPLLLALSIGIAELCKSGLCADFTILLPKMPGKDGAFHRTLRYFAELVPTNRYIIRLIANNGYGINYVTGENPLETSQDTEYANLLTKTYGDYREVLRKRCVRRLGHFKTYNNRTGGFRCRHYSYLMHDCGNELSQCFREWWNSLQCDVQGILYDLGNNDLLREVVIAHANSVSIPSERIVDVVQSEQLTAIFRPLQSCVVILDAIDTGDTFEIYSKQLKDNGIQVLPHLFVGVNKHGDRLAALNVSVNGVIKKSSEATAESCPQCELHLPPTSEAAEELIKVRSFDLLEMVQASGWIKEPVREVPDNVGVQYQFLPNFAEILHHYGDWLAFKTYNALLDRGLPEAWFVIHPEEGDSSTFSQCLYDCVGDQLSIVRVPRKWIKKAQTHGNSWSAILQESSGEDWCQQLRELRDASALVLDIFNASNSTCKSLVSLIQEECHLQVLSYSCVIDFNPDKRIQAIGTVPKLSLYDWHAPRQLVQGA